MQQFLIYYISTQNYALCLGNNLIDFTINNLKETGFLKFLKKICKTGVVKLVLLILIVLILIMF